MKKAIVTGASTGIGLIFAQRLMKDGWDVTGVARSEDKLKANFRNYISADLSTDQGIMAVEKHLAENKYDLLINNAGYGLYGRFTELKLEEQLNMMQLNMNALVRLSHAFLHSAKSGDALLNISSALSLMPMPGAAVYSATKSFVTAFTNCLWAEHKERGVYILTDMPGPVRTDFHEVAGSSNEEMDQKLLLDPENVVSEALRVLKKRKTPNVVNGKFFKTVSRISQLMPRSMRLNIMAKNSVGMKS